MGLPPPLCTGPQRALNRPGGPVSAAALPAPPWGQRLSGKAQGWGGWRGRQQEASREEGTQQDGSRGEPLVVKRSGGAPGVAPPLRPQLPGALPCSSLSVCPCT